MELKFNEVLINLEKKYQNLLKIVHIDGNWNERTEKAIKAVKELIKEN